MDYVAYWNPSEDTLPVRVALDDAIESECELIQLDEVFLPLAELTRARVAVLHRPIPYVDAQGEWKEAGRGWFCNSAHSTQDGFVSVHISTAPITDPPQRVEFEGGGVRYVLSVRNTIPAQLAVRDNVDHARAVEQWRRLLTAIRDRRALDHWMQQQAGHPALDEFFGDKKVEWLPTLAILCQGFLAVHADFDCETGRWGPPAIIKALEDMGWLDALSDVEVRNALRPRKLDDLERQRKTVGAAKWWRDPLGITCDDDSHLQDHIDAFLKDHIDDEWKHGKGGDLEPVRELVISFAQDELECNDLGRVARAYSEIRKNLGDPS